MSKVRLSVEEARKSPEARNQAINFLLETAVMAAQVEGTGVSPMEVLKLASSALQVLGVTEEEMDMITKKMVLDRLVGYARGTK